VVGWGTQAFDDNYTIWTAGGTGIGGLMTLPDQAKKRAHRRTGSTTSTSPTWGARAAKKGGGKVLNGPMGCRAANRVTQCLDPQGATVALHGKRTP
jgi:predicted enzyme related to lactoylglutathione lyase